MNFEELLKNKQVEKVEKEDLNEILALKDIASAKNNFNFGDNDWAFSIAYNAVLRISRSFMQSLGYRPIGKEHHKNVFEFLKESGFNEELINYFDKIRKKRNQFLYGFLEGENKENTEETILKAETFVQEIRTFVQEIRTKVEESKQNGIK